MFSFTRRLLLLAPLSLGLLSAKPSAPAAFCKQYPNAKACEAGPAACTLCHTVAPARNLFGAQLAERIAAPRPLSDEAFLAALTTALKAVDSADADNDGFSNAAEIAAGTAPGDPASMPVAAGCTPQQKAAASKAKWNVCGYDPLYAFKKIQLDFCGQSASRADTAAFAKLAGNRSQWEPALSKALDTCLASRNWLGTDGVVWNLANPKIRPVDSIKSGAKPGSVPLADYEFDYNLFTWANSGDRDVRDLLLAQYFVKRTSDTPPTLQVMTEPELKAMAYLTGQYVEPSKRVGMITTRWFLTVNTMFTAIPRTSAAQAYRSYLGFDISKMEGLHPAPDKTVDYDRKGINTPTCAACHSTLEPLTMPFTRYNGIINTDFAPNRLKNFVRVDGPDVVNAPESGMLLGHEVANLLEWGKVAADSPEFARNVVRDYWKLLIGRDPSPLDQRDYSALWRGLMDPKVHNYRVEKMLHALVLTEAYGTP